MGFRVGSLFIRVEFGFFAVLALTAALSPGGLGLFCAAAGVFHELGHLFWMSFFEALPREMTFSWEGISITPSTRLLSHKKEGLILLGGSLFNLLLACFPFGAEYRLASLCLGFFNLLPLSGLDGGKILALTARSPAGEAFCRVLSFLTAAALSIGAVFLFLQSRNVTLLCTVLYFLLLS